MSWKILSAVVVLVHSGTSWAGCFRTHLREAIDLNEHRRKLYAELTEQRSEPIVKELIRGEKSALILAWYLDLKAKPYQKKGIPFLCDEFVPVSETPEFRSFVPPSQPSPSPMPRIDVASLQARLESSSSEGFEALEKSADHEIEALSFIPQHFCMLRHFLESIRRAARLAPRHVAVAQAAGMKSPEKISKQFIRAHLRNLDRSLKLDEQAYPIQASGIPILCQDVPRIP